MDPKKEGQLNKLIIRISSITLLLVGIGVLIVEYIFWVEHWISNASAVVVFVFSIILYTVIGIAVIKNKKKLFNFGDEDE